MFRFIFLLIGLFSIFTAVLSFVPSDGDSTLSEMKRDLTKKADITFTNLLEGLVGKSAPQVSNPVAINNPPTPVAQTKVAEPSTAGVCMVTLSGQHIPISEYKVTDGDTIRIWGSGYVDYPVRLIGIDAPEKSQRHGVESQDNLDALLQQGGEVIIVAHAFDNYDRILADVCVDGNSVNIQQVAEGMAYTYLTSHIPDPAFRSRLEYTMRQAKRDGVGVHGCTNCVAPHEYRKTNPR